MSKLKNYAIVGDIVSNFGERKTCAQIWQNFTLYQWQRKYLWMVIKRIKKILVKSNYNSIMFFVEIFQPTKPYHRYSYKPSSVKKRI